MGDLDRLGDLLPPQASGRATKAHGQGEGEAASGASVDAVPAGVCAAASVSEEDLACRIAAVWAEEMGPEIAANARPVQLRDSRLVVTTSSSAWAQTLQLMSPMVVERLNERLGEGSVEKAVFRHAGWDPTWGGVEAAVADTPIAGAATAVDAEATDTAAACVEDTASPLVRSPAGAETSPEPSTSEEPVPLSPEEKQALDELDRLPLPPAVRGSIRRAMIADFVRDRQDSGRS